MKRYIIILAALTALSSIAWAQDGAALYKVEVCHVPRRHGRRQSWTIACRKRRFRQSQIADLLTNGAAGKKAPHTKGVAGLSADQASSIATYVASLKK